MTQGRHIQLDYEGDALVPSGYLVVDNEVEFLRHALESSPMLIRGSGLCRWAEEFYRGRGEECLRAYSPVESVKSICQALTEEQARLIYQDLRDVLPQLLPTATVEKLLQALYPDGPWHELPSWQHASRWLLWLDEKAPPDHVQPLIRAQTASWRLGIPEELQRLYEPANAAEAEEVLSWWLAIEMAGDAPPPEVRFPMVVPEQWRERAAESWSRQIVSVGGTLFSDLYNRVPPELMEVAARATFRYYREHASELTRPMVGKLTPYLLEAEAGEIDRLCPPDLPGDLPAEDGEILQWFTDGYLPYRRWESEHGDTAAQERVQRLARRFIEWCLCFYPSALAGSKGHEHLAIAHSVTLHETRAHWVTLWVILDGLHYADGAYLMHLIDAEPRLSGTIKPVISPLPTITQFCKASVMNGTPASILGDDNPTPQFAGAKLLPSGRDPAEALQDAQLGDILVWSVAEPDRTYHLPNDRVTLANKVRGQLQTLARQVVTAALAVPQALPVRVVISTDHGRLMSTCERVLKIPSGMEAHGRAAWGGTDKRFDISGFLLEDDPGLVFLEAERFRLPADCAIALGQDVFLTADGRKGSEQFPHGGLFPEEVLVPWIEYIRDWRPPKVTSTLKGEAHAGRAGEASLHTSNPSDTVVTVRSISISLPGQTVSVSLDYPLQAMHSEKIPVPLPEWPKQEGWDAARASLDCMLPNGFSFTVQVGIECMSREMYRRKPLF